jgi:suppressor of fused
MGPAERDLTGAAVMVSSEGGEETPPGNDLVAYLDKAEGAPREEIFIGRRGTVEQIRMYALDSPPHWHCVTVGLAELGFELTIRLGRTGDDPPSWVVDLLANLGAYVFRTGRQFADGHHIDLRGPIKLNDPTAITAAAIVVDPGLKGWQGVEFLQLVGLTADELELCRSWRTDAVIDLLAKSEPLLITRLDRTSLLDDPTVRELAESGVAAEGSALEELRVGTLRWDRRGWRKSRLVVTMGAGAATGLGPALRRKLNRPGASFRVIGDVGEIRFVVAPDPGWEESSDAVVVSVPLTAVDELAAVFSGKVGSGSLAILPGLRFVVAP